MSHLDAAGRGLGDASVPARPRRASVIVASTRAAAGVYDDLTGPVIRDWLRAAGLETGEPVVVPDGPPVAEALRAALAGGVDLVITTGGTGLTPTDRTPEATAPLLTATLPGFQEELRRRGAASTPYALMSRGLAGLAGRTLIINLPGSTGGVRDGLGLLGEVLDHVLTQIEGDIHHE